MKTVDVMAIISPLSQEPEICAQGKLEAEAANNSGHPFGSVLLRLELALGLICASRKQALPTKTGASRRRLPHGAAIS